MRQSLKFASLVALLVFATPEAIASGSAHQSSILVILEGKSTPKPKPNPWPICIPTVGHGCPP